jgi:chitinase
MFGALDTQHLPNNPRIVNGVTYTAWQPQDLERRWNEFMKSKYFLAVTRTMKVLNTFLPVLQQNWATQAHRDNAKPDDGDSSTIKANKEAAQNLIDDIDALDQKMRILTPWKNPF